MIIMILIYNALKQHMRYKHDYRDTAHNTFMLLLLIIRIIIMIQSISVS